MGTVQELSPGSPPSTERLPAVLDSKLRLPELDGLRGVAVLMVIWFHYALADMRIPNPTVAWVLWPFKLGWSGVDLFFVLSGFLIGGILLDNAASPRFFRTFYTRRAGRIFPLYYLLVVLFAIGSWAFDQRHLSKLILPFINHGPVWVYATFTQNFWMAFTSQSGAQFNAITWSLAIEEHFYLILPVLIHASPRRALPWILGGLTIAAVGLRIFLALEYPQHPFAGYLVTFCRLDALCIGVACALWLRTPEVWRVLATRRSALLAAIAALSTGTITINYVDSRFNSWTMSAGGYTLLAALFAAILLYAITFTDSVLARTMRAAPLVYVGQISFCLYLIHQPVNVLCYAYLRNKLPALQSGADVIAPAAALAISFALATLSWKVLEGPLVRLARRASY